MGKQGPCYHCGVASTPLWRNGPPDKPVLCNACGSRWRTKGSLANYFPLHLREFPSSTENKIPKSRSIAFKPNDLKSYSKKQNKPVLDRSSSITQIKRETPYCGQNFPKAVEEDITSNRSSSGSVVSFSESCAHFETTDANDLTDTYANELTASAQSNAWEPLVPSERKGDIARPKSSRVEKLTKDLYNILHEQSSDLSRTSEEDLIFESEAPTGSIEIGHGGVLIKLPDSKIMDEESEASSLPIECKSYVTNEAYSGSTSFVVHNDNKGATTSHIANKNVATAQMADQVNRGKFANIKLHVQQARESSLVSIDLQDVVTFEAFAQLFSYEEQQQLTKYLPPVDTAKGQKSIKSLFESPQFVEALLCFQRLFAEGIFDNSFLGENTLKSEMLKKPSLCNLMSSTSVEHYKQLKDLIHKGDTCQEEATILMNIPEPSNLISLKRPLESQSRNFSELKDTMRSPKRLANGIREIHGATGFLCEAAAFGPESVFALPCGKNSIPASFQTIEESSDQDLLVDVPLNGSFPEAELLFSPYKRNCQ